MPTLQVLTWLALLNVLLVGGLWAAFRRSEAS
jgi:hypothetical protein